MARRIEIQSLRNVCMSAHSKDALWSKQSLPLFLHVSFSHLSLSHKHTHSFLTPTLFHHSNNSKHPPEPSRKWKYWSPFQRIISVRKRARDKCEAPSLLFNLYRVTFIHSKGRLLFLTRVLETWAFRQTQRCGARSARGVFNHVRDVNTFVLFCSPSRWTGIGLFPRLRWKQGKCTHALQWSVLLSDCAVCVCLCEVFVSDNVCRCVFIPPLAVCACVEGDRQVNRLPCQMQLAGSSCRSCLRSEVWNKRARPHTKCQATLLVLTW